MDQLQNCGIEAVTADWIAPYIFEIVTWSPMMVLLGGFNPGMIHGRWSLCGAPCILSQTSLHSAAL